QVEFRFGVAAPLEALGKIEEESGEALLRAHRAQQQHDAVVAHDLAREHRMQAALQRRHFPADLVDQRVRHRADVAVFERDRAARAALAAHGVHSEQLAAHEEAGDLLAPVAVDQAGLEEAGADGIEAPELVARGEQALAAPDPAARVDDVLDPLELLGGHAAGEAGFAQIAFRAAHPRLASKAGSVRRAVNADMRRPWSAPGEPRSVRYRTDAGGSATGDASPAAGRSRRSAAPPGRPRAARRRCPCRTRCTRRSRAGGAAARPSVTQARSRSVPEFPPRGCRAVPGSDSGNALRYGA